MYIQNECRRNQFNEKIFVAHLIAKIIDFPYLQANSIVLVYGIIKMDGIYSRQYWYSILYTYLLLVDFKVYNRKAKSSIFNSLKIKKLLLNSSIHFYT